MKRNLVLLVTCLLGLSAVAQQDPVLMRINGKDVTRSEFEYIYNKNNSLNEQESKTLDEYVDLFVNFKLKVAAAEAAGIDTTRTFREELEGYRRQLAKSYLTDEEADRTNSKCVKKLKLGDCLTARNHLAKRLSADSLVSFHINWDPEKKRSGAMILAAYNSGYNKYVSTTTQALGSSIMANLQELGIKSEGFWFRTLHDEKYKNGAKADYYSIVREGVLNKIPSLIIEHGYVSNKSDCNNYFKTAEQRKSLGVADAKGIINYYKLSAKNIEGDFQTISGKTYFVDKEGNKIAGWVKKDGKWYHFNNKTAVMNKGFFKEAGNKFYLNPKTGEMTSGWFTIRGKSYLAKGNGVVVTNQIYTDGVKSYFFKKSGKRKNGWVTYKNAKYYFSKTKGMLKGKQKIKGKRYTFSKKTGKLRKKK